MCSAKEHVRFTPIATSIAFFALGVMPLDPDWIESLSPYEAQQALDRLVETFKDGMSVHEAVQLQNMKRALKAKTQSTYEPDT